MLGGGHREDRARSWREFVEGEVVGGTEFLLPLGGAEYVPALDGYPEDAGDVRGGKDAVGLEEFGVMLLASRVGDDASAAVVLLEPHPGEHLAADGLVSDPEDKTAELRGFEHVREAEEIRAYAVEVYAVSFP